LLICHYWIREAEAVPGIPDQSSLKIENTNVETAPGVSLSSQQQTIVGSILDLFAGRPSLQKLALWRDDATFEDPITIAQGREKYQAQWYGLQSAFSEIERQHHSVKDAGNPILMDLKTRYVIKGINKEQIVSSVVAIHLDGEGKIQKVQDKWDGKLPDGAIANVSIVSCASLMALDCCSWLSDRPSAISTPLPYQSWSMCPRTTKRMLREGTKIITIN
jgi:hypothetical protein